MHQNNKTCLEKGKNQQMNAGQETKAIDMIYWPDTHKILSEMKESEENNDQDHGLPQTTQMIAEEMPNFKPKSS